VAKFATIKILHIHVQSTDSNLKIARQLILYLIQLPLGDSTQIWHLSSRQ